MNDWGGSLLYMLRYLLDDILHFRKREESVPSSEDLVNGSPAPVRDPRINALREQGDVGSLRAIFAQEGNLAPGLDAAEALAQLGDESGVDALIHALEGPSAYLSDYAADILLRLNNFRGNEAVRSHRQALERPSFPRDAPESILAYKAKLREMLPTIEEAPPAAKAVPSEPPNPPQTSAVQPEPDLGTQRPGDVWEAYYRKQAEFDAW